MIYLFRINRNALYLLNSILEDLLEDEELEFKPKDDGYYFSSKVYYPNNSALTKQKVYIDKNSKVTKVEIVDKDGNIQIVMQFTKQEYNKKFDNKYFLSKEMELILLVAVRHLVCY